MPTTVGREPLMALAGQCFIQQDWPEKELIIVYEEPFTIGAKLNRACELAKGDILIRWDSDDWSATTRITDQVNRLIQNQKSISGYNSMYFWDMLKNRASKYTGTTDYSLGTSLCFTRKYWEANRFKEDTKNGSYGEDLFFQEKARADKNTLSIQADQMMVARLHGSNCSSNKVVFPVVPIEALPKQFFTDMNGG